MNERGGQKGRAEWKCSREEELSYAQWEPRESSPSGHRRRKRSKHGETRDYDRDHGVGYKKIEERRTEKEKGEGVREDEEKNEKRRETRESCGEGRTQARSDLRYETLIKIISSASVGCRGAYTTASRECNDLNGNNSVKDGCSRPCTSTARRPRRCFWLFVPHEPRVKKEEKKEKKEERAP